MRMGSPFSIFVTDEEFARRPAGTCAMSIRPAGQMPGDYPGGSNPPGMTNAPSDAAVGAAVGAVLVGSLLLGVGTLVAAGVAGYYVGKS